MGRAVVILVIAVVVGVLLLPIAARQSGPGPGVAASSTQSTQPQDTTTTQPSQPGGTTTTTVPRSTVKVLVANGTSVSGAAGHFSQVLQSQGWAPQAPVDTTSPVSASAVYYATGQQAAAAALATGLGLQASVVQPLSSAVPVSGADGMGVVLVVGNDLANQLKSGSSTSTSG